MLEDLFSTTIFSPLRTEPNDAMVHSFNVDLIQAAEDWIT